MIKLMIGLILLSSLALGGCASMGASQNQVTVAWSQACHKVAVYRTTIETRAKAGDYTALQKAEIKSVNDQTVGLCSAPPTSANASQTTAKVTALATQLAIFAGVNSVAK